MHTTLAVKFNRIFGKTKYNLDQLDFVVFKVCEILNLFNLIFKFRRDSYEYNASSFKPGPHMDHIPFVFVGLIFSPTDSTHRNTFVSLVWNGHFKTFSWYHIRFVCPNINQDFCRAVASYQFPVMREGFYISKLPNTSYSFREHFNSRQYDWLEFNKTQFKKDFVKILSRRIVINLNHSEKCAMATSLIPRFLKTGEINCYNMIKFYASIIFHIRDNFSTIGKLPINYDIFMNITNQMYPVDTYAYLKPSVVKKLKIQEKVLDPFPKHHSVSPIEFDELESLLWRCDDGDYTRTVFDRQSNVTGVNSNPEILDDNFPSDTEEIPELV